MATEVDPKLRRRYVYMDDATWSVIRITASGLGITMSEAIRQAVIASLNLTVKVDGDAITIDPPPLEAGAHPAVRKDDQLRYVNPVRPAPKPARRKR
jgi:hypothetical protein